MHIECFFSVSVAASTHTPYTFISVNSAPHDTFYVAGVSEARAPGGDEGGRGPRGRSRQHPCVLEGAPRTRPQRLGSRQEKGVPQEG